MKLLGTCVSFGSMLSVDRMIQTLWQGCWSVRMDQSVIRFVLLMSHCWNFCTGHKREKGGVFFSGWSYRRAWLWSRWEVQSWKSRLWRSKQSSPLESLSRFEEMINIGKHDSDNNRNKINVKKLVLLCPGVLRYSQRQHLVRVCRSKCPRVLPGSCKLLRFSGWWNCTLLVSVRSCSLQPLHPSHQLCTELWISGLSLIILQTTKF